MASIGEASERSGVHVETIRYYERIGLTPHPSRGINGRRRYSDNEIGRLAFIHRARGLGFALDDIRALLSLAAQDANCASAQELAVRHRTAIRARIKALRELDRALSDAVSKCHNAKLPSCPVLEMLSASIPEKAVTGANA